MPKAIILMYHNIDNPPKGARIPNLYVTPGMFKFQMWYLKMASFRVLSVQDLVASVERGETRQNMAAITFDDGPLKRPTVYSHRGAFHIAVFYSLLVLFALALVLTVRFTAKRQQQAAPTLRILGAGLVACLSVGTAIYLTEYTREGWTTRIIRFGSECLAGVPSIILGLFGFVLFVMKLGLGWSVLSGAMTLAVMVLPIIIRTSEEAIKAVPQEYRQVCYSLGMSQWQTITRIVLPSALPGITTGIMLSIGRSLGETAVLLFTAGAALRTPLSVFDSGRTMAVHFYILAREGLSMPNAYGTAAVLVVSILAVNLVAYTLMQRMMKRYS